MIFQTPRFWYEGDGAGDRFLSDLLAPAGRLWAFAARKRFALHYPVPMEKPVICVGNLTAGGAGKTPVALSLNKILQDLGHNPHYLTRGYGGTEKGPLQVALSRDTASDVGDEALLLAEMAPTWVSRNRALGAQAAFDTGASVVVMDDGFQNPAFHKDFSIIVVDGAAGFGNGRAIPAGPLREDVVGGLARAHGVVILGPDRAGVEGRIRKVSDIPILKAGVQPDPENPDLKDCPVYAFAGIGRPEKFRDTLIAAGAKVEGWSAFPDHYRYAEEDLRELMAEAEKHGARIVTTAKDFVRLPEKLRERTSVFRIRVAWEDPAAISALIAKALKARALYG